MTQIRACFPKGTQRGALGTGSGKYDDGSVKGQAITITQAFLIQESVLSVSYKEKIGSSTNICSLMCRFDEYDYCAGYLACQPDKIGLVDLQLSPTPYIAPPVVKPAVNTTTNTTVVTVPPNPAYTTQTTTVVAPVNTKTNTTTVVAAVNTTTNAIQVTVSPKPANATITTTVVSQVNTTTNATVATVSPKPANIFNNATVATPVNTTTNATTVKVQPKPANTTNTTKVTTNPAVVVAPVTTSTPISGLSKDQQQAFDTLNLYRTNPAAALADVQAERERYNRKEAYPGEWWLMLEGNQAYDDAIAFLAKQKPLAALKWNDALTKAAEFHNADIGPKGLTQHESSDGTSFYTRVQRYFGQKAAAENIDFGTYEGKRSVLRFVIDNGVPSRGHRNNIFYPAFTDVGIALGPHAEYVQMLTMDFGTNL